MLWPVVHPLLANPGRFTGQFAPIIAPIISWGGGIHGDFSDQDFSCRRDAGDRACGFDMARHGSGLHPEQEQACTSDAFRLCSSEIPNVDRVTACMVAKKSQLSPPCRAPVQT